MTTKKGAPRLIVVLAVALLASVLGAGLAFAGANTFNDVGETHPFHDEIEAIASAGITTGIPDGGYHPSAAVTRQSMAAFMHRGFGRAEGDDGTVPSANDNTEYNVAQVSITSGAASAQGGYVVLTGTVDGSFSASNCPCHVRSELLDVTANDDRAANVDSVGNDPTLITATFASTSSTWIFAIPANTTRTYRLNGSSYTTGATNGSIGGQLSAVYVPFDGSGNVG